jgi:aminoglycoside phosphotransferase (APT) family kinase protein
VTPDAQLPPAETPIDIALVRALLAEQQPDLAALPLVDAGEGWDNRMFRLGDDLVVRLPRRAIAAPLIEQEHRWLPILAPQLPLAIPSPVHIGRAGCGFPWPWSVTRWLPGQTALVVDFDHLQAARDLAGFLRALQQPAPDDAPRSSWRGVPLVARDPLLRKDLARAEDRVDRAAVAETWERLRATTPWKGAALWIHGDLHPDNIVVHGGRVSGVLDFGDLAAGDPAMDLSVAWMLLKGEARSTFHQLTCGVEGWLDHDAWLRGRAWALAIGVAYIAHVGTDGASGAIAAAAIEAAVSNPES